MAKTTIPPIDTTHYDSIWEEMTSVIDKLYRSMEVPDDFWMVLPHEEVESFKRNHPEAYKQGAEFAYAPDTDTWNKVKEAEE